jgi:phosphoserine phosphatase
MGDIKKTRLVVFDVEGVLIPKNRFIFAVGRSLGFSKLIKLLFYGFLYESGIVKLDSALRKIFKELKGVELETLMLIFATIPSTPYLQNIFSQIKVRNCKIALISSGLPTVMVKRLAIAVGAEYAYGIEVETKDDKLTGEIRGDAIDPSGKL